MTTSSKRQRIDQLLIDRELAPSLERARAFIMAGIVFSNGIKIEKPGQMVEPGATLEVRSSENPFVSRGGLKLAGALDAFAIDPVGCICMDVGASTGGFTDCLIQRGAKKVYAIDVGYGQLNWSLKQNPKVISIERTNMRLAGKELIDDLIELAVADVSFISLTLILPSIDLFLAPKAAVIALIKPQFEVGRDMVGKGGIVHDKAAQQQAVEKIRTAGEKLGWRFMGKVESPILGAKGNREFLIYFMTHDR